MNTIRIRQHEEFERPVGWWIWLWVGVVILMVMSFAAPLWIHDGYGGSVNSWSNRLNAGVLLLIVGCYVYAGILYNKHLTLWYDDQWFLYREWKKRVALEEFASYSLTHHGSKNQYYTLFLLDPNGFIQKILPFADSSEQISHFLDFLENHLPARETVQLHRYEKIQRRLKI